MLTKKDKEWIEKTLTKALQDKLEELVITEVVFEERAKDERTGQMVNTGKKKTERVNILYHVASYISGIERTWRGYQADIDRMKSQMNKNNNIVNRLLTFQEKTVKLIGGIANVPKETIDYNPVLQIEDIEEEK